MAPEGKPDFYASYGDLKSYRTPTLRKKHIERFDQAFWRPAVCAPEMSVLDLGCGLGSFLLYLRAKGVGDFLGVDQDPNLEPHIPAEVRDRFRVADVWDFLGGKAGGRRFDRIALFDVLEHFSPEEGFHLLSGLKGILAPGGRIVVRVPNAESPWGAKIQFGDLTHKAAYTPGSIRQLAIAAGLDCTRCLPYVQARGPRRYLDAALNAAFSACLETRPDIWSATFVAVFAPPEA